MILNEILVKLPTVLPVAGPTGVLTAVPLATFLASPYCLEHTDLFRDMGGNTYLVLKSAPGSYTPVLTREEEVRVVPGNGYFFLSARKAQYSFEFTTKNGRFFIYQLLRNIAEMPSIAGPTHVTTSIGGGTFAFIEVLDYVNTELRFDGTNVGQAPYTQRIGWFTSIEFVGGTVTKDVELGLKLTQEIKIKFMEASARRTF